MHRKVAVVTSSRADYSHLRWLLRGLGRHPRISLEVVVFGPHLSPEFGRTADQLEGRIPKITAVECLLSSDTDVGMAKTLGVATLGLADALGGMRPDILVLTADRYEMLAAASVALTLRIPMAHIEGGETSAGAIDDAVRNALTKMAHLHFACTERARARVIGLDEESWRVTFSGSLSLDGLRQSRLLTKAALEKKLGIRLRPDLMVVVHHPVTLMRDPAAEARELFAALAGASGQVVVTYPNADAGAREIVQMAEAFVRARPANRALFVNLGQIPYLSLLKYAAVLIGNSSSGIIESTSLQLPTLNVGIRQQGREHAANVIDVPASRKAILDSLKTALSGRFRNGIRGLQNPYDNGGAADIIVRGLVEAPLGPGLLIKRPRTHEPSPQSRRRA